jgi:hypothetical protein
MSHPIQQQQHLNIRSNSRTRSLYRASIFASFSGRMTGTSGSFLLNIIGSMRDSGICNSCGESRKAGRRIGLNDHGIFLDPVVFPSHPKQVGITSYPKSSGFNDRQKRYWLYQAASFYPIRPKSHQE